MRVTDWETMSERMLLAAAACVGLFGASVLYRSVTRAASELPVTESTSPVITAQAPAPLRLADFVGAGGKAQSGLMGVDALKLAGGVPLSGDTPSAEVSTPPSITALLSVITAGPRREVWLKDVHLGQSPYVGQLECEKGARLDFLLRHKDGSERQVTRVCAREIKITQ
jgi:hypothetical protein